MGLQPAARGVHDACLQVGLAVKDKDGNIVRMLDIPAGWDTQRDKDHVALLCHEVTSQVGPCQARHGCQE